MPNDDGDIPVTKSTVAELAARGLIEGAQVERIVSFLSAQQASHLETRFTLVHLLWYFGTAIGLIAFGLFASQVSETYGQFAFGAILSVYAVILAVFAVAVTAALKARCVLGGLLIAAAVLTAGAAVVHFQEAKQLLHHEVFPFAYTPEYAALTFSERLFHSPLLAVLSATACAAIGLVAYRFVPLIVLVTLGCWYMAIDWIAPNDDDSIGLTLIALGILTVSLAWIADRHAQANYGFWLNKLGMWILPLGLTLLFYGTRWPSMALFAFLNALLIGLALYLRRPAGVLGGAIGLFLYGRYLYEEFFKEELLFPFVVAALGGVTVFIGWKLYREYPNLDLLLPKTLRSWRPPERSGAVTFSIDQGVVDSYPLQDTA